MALRGNRLLQALCDQRWLRRIGKYSYSMYVFHFVVQRAVEVCLARAHLPRLFGSRVIEQLLALSLVTLDTFLVALLKLKEHYSYRRAQRRADVPDELHRSAHV